MKPMVQQFLEARTAEWTESGSVPCVAVVGHFDFDTLAGELATMFGLSLDRHEAEGLDKIRNHCEFQGVVIFRSASIPHGIFIGSPREQKG